MGILDLVYPKYCLECRQIGQYICSKCLFRVSTVHIISPDGYAIWRYEGVIRKAILALKYKFASDIANELATLASSEIVNCKLKIENSVLVPIPLHSKRQRWRGFNQSEELGKRIAKQLGMGYNKDLLVRVVNTPPQVRLHKAERLRNTRGIFALKTPNEALSEVGLDRKDIILFDDVWTTGSTLNEAARVLKKAGAKRIIALAIAR